MRTITKLLTIIFTLSAMVIPVSSDAANSTTTVTQVTSSVDVTGDVDYVITGETPFATAGSVNIVDTEHAVVRISAVKPSNVITTWMDHIFIKGEAASPGVNCQVRMYNRGAIIFPYSSDIRPLTCYTEQNFEGDSFDNYTEGHSGGYMKTLTTYNLNNRIRSFKLKRGYMVTFAIGTGGWGYSRCFIADQEDLEFATLPAILDQKISSYRIFQWYNFHKAGLASNGSSAANKALNTSGCYDWAQGNSSNLPDTEWVPNHIYEDWPSSSTCGSVTGSCHMKTNNEPGNSADDHPQDVATVLGNWENLMRTGLRLCSESSHDGSMSHLKAFIDSIDARGWRCDILDLHCYWASGFNNLNWYSSNYGNGRPIWISEWIWGASWNSNGAFASGATESSIYNNTVSILNTLNSNDKVERYFYWNSESKAHIYENGSLTNLGKYYSTMETGLGYKKANEYIPKATRYEAISSLSSKYTAAKGTVALSWDDPNGDLMNSITVQCKLPDTSSWKDIASVTPKDKSSKSGVSYAYTDTVSEPGVYYYRVKEVWFDGRTSYYTDEVTVNVAPAQGTSRFQHGRLSVDSDAENSVLFSEQFDDAPKVFIGIMSNKNSSYNASNFLKSVTQKQFVYNFQTWQTNTASINNNEEVPFFALKPGSYLFDGHDGMDLQCEVGEVKSAKSSTELWSDTTEVVFDNPFPDDVVPIVLTEVRAPVYKTTGFNVRVFDVTSTGFKFIVYTEEASGVKVSLPKNVEYMAITPGVGVIDAENDLYIAAGRGLDNQIYGSAQRENTYYLERYDEEGDSVARLPLYMEKPTVLGALQTNNYPSLCVLRRTDVTEKDTDGETWFTGLKTKRTFDHNITVNGSIVARTTTNEAYRDDLGWVCVSSHILIGPDKEEINAGTSLPGDVNNDGVVDINDVVAVINHIAGVAVYERANVNGDTDDDGNPIVDINDVVAVINYMAGK